MSVRLLLSDSLVYLLAWLVLFSVTRLVAYVCSPPAYGGLTRLLLDGVAHDVGGFAILWPIWFLVQVFWQGTAPARYVAALLFLLVAPFAFMNALFVAWAHEPLNHGFLTYLSDADDLAVSARALLPARHWLLLWLGGVLAVLAAAIGHAWRSSKGGVASKPAFLLGGWLLVAALTATSWTSSARGASAPGRRHRNAIAANLVLCELAYAVSHPRENADAADTDFLTGGLTPEYVRSALVQDQGRFVYLSDKYPLAKRNLSFSRPGRRKDVWDRTANVRPNVVVLFLESFRARDIGAYGSTKGLTPVFDGLAQKGWLWENFYANSTQTDRAALATLCSMYSYVGPSIQRSQPTTPLRGLPAILKEEGYETAYYHNGSIEFGLKTPFFRSIGFDVLLGKEELDPEQKLGESGWGFPDVPFAEILAERLNAQEGGKPLFLTAFTVSHHHPWDQPDPALNVVEEVGREEYPRFQNSQHYSDYALGVLFERLEPKVLNNTIFVVLADTAQPMGEHDDNFALLVFLYEENLRIPLLVYAPGFIKEGRRFPDVASQVDVMPTLLDMLNIKCANHAVGRSLLAECETPIAYFSNPHFECWVGIRRGRYKLIAQLQHNEFSLFNLEADPDETENLIEHAPEVAAELRQSMEAKMRATQFLVGNERTWFSSLDSPFE